jgi:hypothetical protein
MNETNLSPSGASASPTNPTPVASASAPDASAEIQALRRLVLRLQTALIALTWIVGVYVFIHFWRARGELEVVRPQAAQIIEASKRTDAAVNQFVTQLVEYARTHPDFVPVISKYPIQMPAGATNAAPKPAAPAAPATPPKK